MMSRMVSSRRMRFVFFTVIAVVAGLLLLELAARGFEKIHPPEPVEARSPLAYQQLPPEKVAQTNIDGRDYFMAHSEWDWQLIPVHKKPKEIRVVLLGGSALAGLGFPRTGTFTCRAERLLDGSPSGPTVRLINLGRTGCASAQMAEIFVRSGEELAPDLVVTIMGNNEYLDAAAHFSRGPEVPKRVIKARWMERHLALARLFRPMMRAKQPPASNPVLMGLPRTPEVRKFVNNRLRQSLHKIHAETKRIGAKMLICTVPLNYRYQWGDVWSFAGNFNNYPEALRIARWALAYDCPEKAVEPLRQLLAESPDDTAARLILGVCLHAAGRIEAATVELERVRDKLMKDNRIPTRWNERSMLAWAIQLLKGEETEKIADELLVAAEKEPSSVIRDRGLADLYYYLGRYDSAREWDTKNLIADTRPYRAYPETNETLMTTAAELGAASYDLAGRLAGLSSYGAPGFDFFYDYCHYNTPGHVVMAQLLAIRLARELKLPVRLDSPQVALQRHIDMRRGRLTDLPEMTEWMGADFDVPQLVDKCTLDYTKALERLKQALEAGADPTLAEVFSGNWHSQAGIIFSEKAISHYRRALAIDPNAAGANENIAFVEQYLHR